jgi:hypothetical protein
MQSKAQRRSTWLTVKVHLEVQPKLGVMFDRGQPCLQLFTTQSPNKHCGTSARVVHTWVLQAFETCDL